MTIRSIIVDDEPPARKKVRHFLRDDPRFEVVGEAGDGLEGAELIAHTEPDLVFLDIQMPRMDGFEMLRGLEAAHIPHVVFTTAYDQYAIRAFEVHALDYLLKPFDADRFRDSLERAAREILQKKNFRKNLQALLAEAGRSPFTRRLVLKSGGRITFLRTDEIAWIEAAGKYVHLHAGKASYLYRDSMSGMEGRLDPDRFFRVHRSAIVHVEFVHELQPWSKGDYIILLKNGTRVPLGRAYRDRFLRSLQRS